MNAAGWPRIRHELFFRKHPHDTDREYFHHVFNEVGKVFPAAKDLFAEGRRLFGPFFAPSGDAAMRPAPSFWREIDAESRSMLKRLVSRSKTATLVSWAIFYQELSERGPKRSLPCCKRQSSWRSSFSTEP